MRALYAHPLDNLLRSAVSVTLTTGTPVAGSSVADVYAGHWVRGLEIDGVNLALDMEFAAPVAPVFAVLGHSNATVAAHLWGHVDATFGGGTPDVDLAFSVPTQFPNGFFSSPFLAPAAAPAAKAFWRLRILANTYNVGLGQFLMSATPREFECSYVMPGAQPSLRGATIVHRTYGGVKLTAEQATAIRTIDGTLHLTAAELEDLEALVAAARFGARPFFFVPREDVDDAWLVQFAADDLPEIPVGVGPHEYDVRVPLEMCARGEPWIDPDA